MLLDFTFSINLDDIFHKKNMSFRCFLQKEYILLFHYIIPNRNC